MKWQRVGNGSSWSVARLASFAVVLSLLVILGYRQVQRLRGTSAVVWVAAVELAEGSKVAAEHLVRAKLPAAAIPPNIVNDRGIIEGRRLAVVKAAGMPFFGTDFAPDLPARLAELLPEGRVLSLLSTADFPAERFGLGIRFGDRFDVLAISEGQAITVAHDVFYLGFLSRRQPAQEQVPADRGLLSEAVASITAAADRPAAAPSPLLLAVRPADAVSLFQARAAGVPLAVVLHGQVEVERNELLELPRLGDVELGDVEVITGATRERISLREFELR